jgi:hypothetical protein
LQLSLAGIIVGTAAAPGQPDEAAASIAQGKLPSGYRDWRLISVAREKGILFPPHIPEFRSSSPLNTD